jgi:hypothetical protein
VLFPNSWSWLSKKKLIGGKNHFYLNFVHNCNTNFVAVNSMNVKTKYLNGVLVENFYMNN